MDCRAVLAVMVYKRMKSAAKVQEALTKNGCLIRVRIDDFVKSPSAALQLFYAAPEGRGPQGPHSSVFARLASGAFYEVILSLTFYEFTKYGQRV